MKNVIGLLMFLGLADVASAQPVILCRAREATGAATISCANASAVSAGDFIGLIMRADGTPPTIGTPKDSVNGAYSISSPVTTAGNRRSQFWGFANSAAAAAGALTVTVPLTATGTAGEELTVFDVPGLGANPVDGTALSVGNGNLVLTAPTPAITTTNPTDLVIAWVTASTPFTVTGTGFTIMSIPGSVNTGMATATLSAPTGSLSAQFSWTSATNVSTGIVALKLPVTPPPLSIVTPSALPAATAGVAYSVTLQATGGSGNYTWMLASGSTLPAGLSLNASTGVISGTPTASGSFAFTISVTSP
jgi:Putative Ig domain